MVACRSLTASFSFYPCRPTMDCSAWWWRRTWCTTRGTTSGASGWWPTSSSAATLPSPGPAAGTRAAAGVSAETVWQHQGKDIHISTSSYITKYSSYWRMVTQSSPPVIRLTSRRTPRTSSPSCWSSRPSRGWAHLSLFSIPGTRTTTTTSRSRSQIGWKCNLALEGNLIYDDLLLGTSPKVCRCLRRSLSVSRGWFSSTRPREAAWAGDAMISLSPPSQSALMIRGRALN